MSRLFDSMVALERPAAGSTPAVRTSFIACVMDGGFDDPIADTATETTRRAVSVIVRRNTPIGWNLVQKPSIGDVLTIEAKRFRVYRVRAFGNVEYIMEARSC